MLSILTGNPFLSETQVKFITWRDYDEILRLKEVVDKIISKRHQDGGIIDPEYVLQEFKAIEKIYRRRIKKVFPRIKRWASIATMLSVPVAIFGLAVDQPLVAVASGVLAGSSKLSEELVDYLTSKWSWVSFIAKENEIRTLKAG